MCGISGLVYRGGAHRYRDLLRESDIRGQDGTGLAILEDDGILVQRWPQRAKEIDKSDIPPLEPLDRVIGQNRLAIFGLGHENDQPLTTDRFALVHNGNLLHFEEKFAARQFPRTLKVDTELILRYIERDNPQTVDGLARTVECMMGFVEGNMACLLLDKQLGVMAAFARDKPLYRLDRDEGTYFFSTERIGRKVFGDAVAAPVANITIL